MLKKSKVTHIIIPVLVLNLLLSACGFAAEMLDISDCVIVTAGKANQLQAKYVTVLQEEIAKRTGAKPAVTDRWPNGKSVISVGVKGDLKKFAGPCYKDYRDLQIGGTEGFAIYARTNPAKSVVIIGEDERGMLYGIGWFLRKAEMRKGSIKVPADLKKISVPAYPLRGHQLGYRPKTNAYDAWTFEIYDQYIRELSLFGSNAIEILPPLTDDQYKNELMLYEPLEMMIKLSEIIDSYGLDVWIWYPNVGYTNDADDFIDEKLIARHLKERDEVFKALKRVDHILVPGGDPGDLHPNQFFPWMDRVAPVMHKYHPKAKIWVSPQAWPHPTREWLSTFYEYVNAKPDWLGGVVFAPWVKTPIEKMRQIVDKDIPIRRYTDITHNLTCQYPVKDWDLALALTLHRECYNPRPVAMKTIHNRFDHVACGSLTYSEGINDDINKFVWGDQDWDPQRDVIETLRDYARFFISPDMDDELAQGYIAEERNWVGPLAANSQVDVTFLQWRQMEKQASDQVKNNYRFQMGLMRAYYDKYIRRRLYYETHIEMKAMDILRNAKEYGSLGAIKKAQATLNKAVEEPVAKDLRSKCDYLADELFKNIKSQTYVGKHKARYRTRGAFMEGIDEPLNNRNWLGARFKEILAMSNEQARFDAIEKVLNRINPGPGGFYDNMGTMPSFERISNEVAWEDDPGTLRSPRISFHYRVDRESYKNFPLAWKNQACVVFETPLRLFWDNLDPKVQYRIRVGYTGRGGKEIRLFANDVYKIHDLIDTLKPPIREFDIPKEATADGRLELKWDCGDGQWNTQVSEVWLMKK